MAVPRSDFTNAEILELPLLSVGLLPLRPLEFLDALATGARASTIPAGQ